MTYLIDTDWVIDFLDGRREAIALFRTLRPHGVAISLITFIEIYEGIYPSRDPRNAEVTFRSFLHGTPVLRLNRAIGRRAAHIRGDLRQQGHAVNQRAFDILIAATAIEHGLTLVTRNLRDYQDIPGLPLYPIV